MVRLLVEEARHALLQPNDAQRKRDNRTITSTPTAGAHPAQRVRSSACSRHLKFGTGASLLGRSG
ncbi:MAG: hypothetical protein E5W92_06300 [Mesorhizobium sp.]|nr:MAG: hypothetical protein E5W92_06300 [Mesorhizobium sp.]